MRPPILFLTVAFGVGLWLGLDPFAFPDGVLWGAALPLAAASVWLAPRAPLGAAVGVMAVGGLFLGRGGGPGKGGGGGGGGGGGEGGGGRKAATVWGEGPGP